MCFFCKKKSPKATVSTQAGSINLINFKLVYLCMEILYSTKDEKSEFYAQIEVTKNIWKFLDKLTYRLFDENFMVDDHYRGELKDNDYFSFEKDGVYLIIVMTKERAHIIILGLPDNKEVKEFLFENYSFEPAE